MSKLTSYKQFNRKISKIYSNIHKYSGKLERDLRKLENSRVQDFTKSQWSNTNQRIAGIQNIIERIDAIVYKFMD